MNRDSVQIKVVVRVGEETITAEHRAPLHLSGDRRRWNLQIRKYIADEVDFIASRFTVPPRDVGQAAS